MKKLFLILILSFSVLCGDVFAGSFSRFIGATQQSVNEGQCHSNICCELTANDYVSADNCISTSTGSRSLTLQGSNCETAPTGGCVNAYFVSVPCPEYVTNSVGGCNSTTMYCSTSPVYSKVGAFLGEIGNADSWTYATVIGTDSVAYKCVIASSSGNYLKIFFTYDGLKSINPLSNNRCLSSTDYTALINTNCNLSTGWAKNSGYVTNTTTHETTLDPGQTEAPLTPPSGTTATGPQGTPIDPGSSGTGFDSNKDGFDDVTGQPLPSSSVGSGSGTGDSDGDGTDEVEIKDPEPDEIPAVPSGGEYDTEITAPEKTPLSGLFDIIDSSPFISVIQGTHISLSGSQCLLTTANPVYGQYISFDFCDSNIVNILDYLGIIIVGIATILAILLIFV